MTIFGTSAKFIDAVRKAGLRPRDTHDLSQRAHDDLDRLAAGAGEFRFRLRRDQAGHASRLDLRRHRHRLLLRARRADEAGLARRDPGAGPRHGGRRLRRGRAGRCAARRASSSARGRSRRCRSMFWNDPGRREIPRRLFRALSRHLGAWRLRRMDGAWRHRSSTAAPTPRSIPAACASARRRSTRRSRACRRSLEALAIGQDLDSDVRIVLFVRLAEGVALDDALAEADQGEDPRRRLAAPCAGEDRRGRRHPAHQVRQDHRARGARRRAWPRGEEQGGAGQPGGAGAFPRPAGACDRSAHRGIRPRHCEPTSSPRAQMCPTISAAHRPPTSRLPHAGRSRHSPAPARSPGSARPARWRAPRWRRPRRCRASPRRRARWRAW